MAWLYITYVGESGFLGCAYVQSNPNLPTHGLSWKVDGLPDEPVTQMAVMLIPAELEHNVPGDHKWHNRLLSKEELREASASMGYGICNAKGETQ